MRLFAVPTLWSSESLRQYQELNARYAGQARISEIYGSHAINRFGSGRASLVLPKVSDSELVKHVEETRRLGFSFNYLLNASCLGGLEGTYEGQQQIRQFLAFLADAGVDRVTVTSPMLMELIRIFQPNLTLSASAICYIDSPDKLQFFANLGVQRVMVDIDVTRNFPVLRALRQASSIELGLIVNSMCRLGCPLKSYHYNMNAHFSQIGHFLDETGRQVVEASSLDYLGARCMLQNHLDKMAIMKTAWVRPEDLHHYLEVGINVFKIQGRGAKPGNLYRTIKTYMCGHLPGRYVPFSLLAAGRAGFTLDNEALGGFLDLFVHQPYRCHLGCEDCGHCYRFAEQAVLVDPEEVDRVMSEAEKLRLQALSLQRLIDHLGESMVRDMLAHSSPSEGEHG